MLCYRIISGPPQRDARSRSTAASKHSGFLKKDNSMDQRNRKIKKLILKITEKNLSLLDSCDRSSEYYLEKLFAWQEEYNWVEWEEFRDSWIYCERCKGYSVSNCICYAR